MCEDPKPIIRIINFKLDQPICPRYLNATDRQTDGRLTIAIPRFRFTLRASRGKDQQNRFLKFTVLVSPIILPVSIIFVIQHRHQLQVYSAVVSDVLTVLVETILVRMSVYLWVSKTGTRTSITYQQFSKVAKFTSSCHGPGLELRYGKEPKLFPLCNAALNELRSRLAWPSAVVLKTRSSDRKRRMISPQDGTRLLLTSTPDWGPAC